MHLPYIDPSFTIHEYILYYKFSISCFVYLICLLMYRTISIRLYYIRTHVTTLCSKLYVYYIYIYYIAEHIYIYSVLL
jgi:hypothetical protein